MSDRIGLFGGSFDPIHFGHLISARSLAEKLDLQRLILIPSARPPHKDSRRVSEPQHRLEMARLAVEGDPLFEVSDIECQREGPSYTFHTVHEFRDRLGAGPDLFWIIGADSLPELTTWYRIADLVELITIVTATRPGAAPPGEELLAPWVGLDQSRRLIANRCITPAIDISATDIRARVSAGRSIRYLTPEGVRSYIAAESLYNS